MSTEQTNEWSDTMPTEDTHTLDDGLSGIEEIAPKTPRKTRKNNEVYWLASPPALALKRMVDANTKSGTSNIDVNEVVGWIRSKRALSDVNKDSPTDGSIESTRIPTKSPSWESLSLSSPTSATGAASSSPLQHVNDVKRSRHYSPTGVEQMLHLIDRAEKRDTSKEIEATSSTTTPSWVQLSPSISRTRKENVVDELLNGDLLFLDDELLLSEDSNDNHDNDDIESLSNTAVAIASTTTTTNTTTTTTESLVDSHTTTAVSTEQSSKISLADSDLHEIEDIISIVNEENLLDDLLVSDDIINEDNEQEDTNNPLLDDIDFSQWSDEGDTKSEDNELFDESIVDQHKFLRGIIEKCHEQMYYNSRGQLGREKVLRIKCTTLTITLYIHLRDDWFNTPIQQNTYIHYKGSIDQHRVGIVDNEHDNVIIIHPDLLLSNTQLSDSFLCQRRAVLQARIRASGEANAAMTYGLMLHELLQRVLQSGDYSEEALRDHIRTLIQMNLESLYFVEENEMTAENYLVEMIPNLQHWMNSFYHDEPRETVESMNASHEIQLSINRVLAIEEGIWSPTYGIKGMIDASLEITYHSLHEQQQQPPINHVSIVPLEVKTGRASNYVAHQAQTLLYTLLMSDRYNQPITSGLLYYLKSGTTKWMSVKHQEIRSIIISRNDLASYMVNNKRLPNVQRNMYKCQRCFAVDACAIYHKALENGTEDSFGVGYVFDERTEHLTHVQAEFLRHWDRLITMEEQEMNRFKGEIWSMSSKQRESTGRCIGQLRVDTSFESKEFIKSDIRDKMGRYRYRFIRATITSSMDDTDTNGSTRSFLSSHITVGDPVVISTEDGQIAVAIGFVLDMNETQVVVGIDRPLKTHYQLIVHDRSSNHLPLVQYRLDKDELSSGMALIRNNLINLFTISGGDHRRRALIVDLAMPTFNNIDDIGIDSTTDSLNVDQQAAIKKVLSADDYALLLGMPGSGKTTTIVELIRVLVGRGKRVLVTSYTHSAVDNILLKLKCTHASTIVRLGNMDKINKDVYDLTPNYDGSLSSVNAYAHYYASKRIFATTCLGIHHPVLSRHEFDYCIVDEASQLTLPATLGPIQLARIFILVGDQHQLPPTVIDDDAAKQGLSVSLFERLSKAHPASQVLLRHQYRMNSDIMLVSNRLIYNQQMVCGSDVVAQQQLDLPILDGLAVLHADTNDHLVDVHDSSEYITCDGSACWLDYLLQPEHKVILANTDTLYPDKTIKENILHNHTEARLVYQTVEALISCGITESNIGVITPYRSQVRVISLLLKERPGVEVYTVDRYQGRDKDCILLSMVRSNAEQNVGNLLRDWRRMNVAFTRARKKLIIFGSVSTLNGSSVFTKFLALMKEQQWIYPLPVLAHRRHDTRTELTFNSQPESNLSPVSRRQQHRSRTGPVKRSVTLNDQVLLRHHPLLRDIVGEAMTTTHHDDDYDQ